MRNGHAARPAGLSPDFLSTGSESVWRVSVSQIRVCIETRCDPWFRVAIRVSVSRSVSCSFHTYTYPMTTARTEFLAGVRAELPILLGVTPFGMIYGALAVGRWAAERRGPGHVTVVFAGSAQFVLTQLIATGTPPAGAPADDLVVNLRHMLYSASVAPYVQGLRSRWKWLLAYLLTDEAYAVAIMRYRQGSKPRRHGEHGDRITLTSRAATVDFEGDQAPLVLPRRRAGVVERLAGEHGIGIFLGAQVPPSWSLDFTLPLTFLALLIPVLV